MVFHIWQVIECCSIYIENIVYFVANILVNTLIDEAKEHISFTRMVSISKDNIRMAMRLSEEQLLDNISIFSWACSCEHDKLITVKFSFYNF